MQEGLKKVQDSSENLFCFVKFLVYYWFIHNILSICWVQINRFNKLPQEVSCPLTSLCHGEQSQAPGLSEGLVQTSGQPLVLTLGASPAFPCCRFLLPAVRRESSQGCS